MHKIRACGMLLCLLCPGLLAAQAGTTTTIAGPAYEAGSTRELWLGNEYRDLWTTPIRVPYLNPDAYAGGLKVVERGGGRQTRSLRLQGADGREYVFRSVDKDATGGLPRDLQNTFVDYIIQDQTSAKHPGGALVVPPLLDAVQVLHATPQLAVMPDHPFLGEHRREFAGMLGIIEERPNETEGGGENFAGAVRIAGTETLLEHLEEDPEHRVDSRAYLRARLMDLWLGDWDRHQDQWRWARFDSAGLHVWRPIPRDRDNVFVDYEGLLMGIARSTTSSKWVEFEDDYPNIGGLTENARETDRQFLAGISRAVWDSTAMWVKAQLSDRLIDSALARMPPEWQRLRNAELSRALKSRRDLLPEAADKFYRQLAHTVDVYASDEREIAEITRLPDGAVDVRVVSATGEGAAGRTLPFFHRRVVPDETREVRVYLRGGDDQATVRGDGPGRIVVRVIGGGGDDVLVDSTRGAGRTSFHDDRGNNRLVAGAGTLIDRRPYEERDTTRVLGVVSEPRDRGETRTLFAPWAGWKSNVGVVVGGGPVITRYGFRRDPYVYTAGLRGLYAPQHGRFGAELRADFRGMSTRRHLEVFGRASNLEAVRFHGFGNETETEGDDDRYRVWHTEYLLAPTLFLPVSESMEVGLGATARYLDPEVPAASPVATLDPRGAESFGHAGLRGVLSWDRRDVPAFPRQGFHVQASTAAYPLVWGGDEVGTFGTAGISAAGYLPLPLPRDPTLAVRVGGLTATGDYPFQEAAFIGGSGTIRGYPNRRFTGESSVWGTVEARLPLTRANLFLIRGELGVLGFAESGRVFVDGEDSDAWHSALGTGLFFTTMDRGYTVTAQAAQGEEELRLYLGLGLPF